MSITQQRYTEAKKIIPGGTQLLSKRPEMFAPERWPAYYTKAKGCEVWDLDGKHYYDMTSNGIGACLLGFAYDPVVEAVTRRVREGSMCTLNPIEEVELAERLCAIHPWASAVRYARGGGEIASVAARIARSATGREMVAICGYHGWTDFYLAANLAEGNALNGHLLDGLEPDGVPIHLKGTTVTFHYNSREEFDKVIGLYGDQLACVVVETARSSDPEPGFLEHVRAETKRIGALLIFDEITVGWRNNFGGYHLELGVTPDMAIFGKTLGNGHPISAVIGTQEAMDGAQHSFISSTYWTEAVGPTAALTTLKEMERTRVWEHVRWAGTEAMRTWAELGEKHGLPIHTNDSFPALCHFAFTQDGMKLKTLYTVLMLEEGFLGNTGFYPTLAHTPEIMEKHYKAVDSVFGQIADIVKKGNLDEALGSPVCHSGFGRLIK